MVMSLARGLVELHSVDGAPDFEVTVVTQMARANFDDASLPFAVVRQPGFWKLRHLIRNADLVHLAGPSFLPMLLAKMAHKPYVVEHHNYQAICPNGLLIHMPDRTVCPGHFQARNYGECWKCESAEKSWLHSSLSLLSAFPRRSLVKSATGNIAVSQHVQKRIDMPQTSVVYHGIDFRKANLENPPARLTAGQKICFAYVGRFVPDKGIRVFVEALLNLTKQGIDFEAMLIGDGPERPSIEEQIKAEGLQSVVALTGFLSGESFSSALSRVHVVVMPSIGEETAGLAGIEQMMNGVFVIYAQIGGLPEVIGDGGLSFSPGNSTELAARMKSVIDNPALIEEIGARARTRARQKFALSIMVQKHAAIYRTVRKPEPKQGQ